jgi:hypothetical protein
MPEKYKDWWYEDLPAEWFLGWDVVKDKLDIWWEDTDPGKK